MSRAHVSALVAGAPLRLSRHRRRGGPVAHVALTLVLAALVGTTLTHGGAASFSSGASTTAASAAKRQAVAAYGRLPLAFVRNAGQANQRIRFQAQGRGFGFALTRRQALFSFVGRGNSHGLTLALRFPGANPNVSLVGERPLPGRVNYLLGDDPAKWHTALPSYGAVVYRDLWPGIDLAFEGHTGVLKYELRLRPGAKPESIRLAYAGVRRLSVTAGGSLAIETSLGVLRDARPTSFQVVGGRRVPIASRYLPGQGGRYGFILGRGYEPRYATVIDPGLSYSTFLGSTSSETGFGIAVDKRGNAYVTGITLSSDFPTTPEAFDETHNGRWDTFVTKLNAAGSALVYSTFLGGTGSDDGLSIAVDKRGNAYVAGETDSSDFPTTPGALDETYNGGFDDAFVTKLNPVGTGLVYSSFLGGTGSDTGRGVAVDKRGNAYLVGETRSSDFPTTTGAFDPTFNGNPGTDADAFVTKLNPAGSGLVYSTFLGGDDTSGWAIAVDKLGNAYLTGAATTTGNFPTTPGAFDETYNGDGDAFVTKLNPPGSALVYSSFLGGTANEGGLGIAIDRQDNAYLTGYSYSGDFPTTSGAFDPTFNGFPGSDYDVFVTKLDPVGHSLVYSTFLGGPDGESGVGIAVDKRGNAYTTGFTDSSDFPTTPGAFDPTFNGSRDAFETQLNAAGSALVHSTFLGGASGDGGNAIGVDKAGNAYLTGFTASDDFPVTPGAFDETYNGPGDVFVAKFHR